MLNFTIFINVNLTVKSGLEDVIKSLEWLYREETSYRGINNLKNRKKIMTSKNDVTNDKMTSKMTRCHF